MFERAIALSGQLHLEGLGVNFPAYHQLMSSFAAAQQSFAPTLPYSSYAYAEPCQNAAIVTSVVDARETEISSQPYMSATPSDASLLSTPRSSCPPTPCPPSSEEFAAALLNEKSRRGSQCFYHDENNSRRSSRSSKSSRDRKVILK